MSIRVLPDTSSFGRSLERYLERLERLLHVNIGVGLDDTDVARSEGVLDELARDRKVNLGVDVDRRMLDRFESILGGVGSAGGNAAGLLSGAASSAGDPLKLAVILGAVAAALPVIATSILALPGLIAAIAVPIGAVLLGLDGIKKAAEVLIKPFLAMQRVVSGVFERQLTPVFAQLRKVMGPLTVGFSQIARAVSDVFAHIVAGLTSTKGLAKIGSIFARIGKAIHILAPSFEPLTGAFLTLIDAGAKAFVEIAPALASMITQFAKFVAFADRTGLLADAFTYLGKIILVVVGVFGALVAGGALAAAVVSRGWGLVKKLFTNLPEIVSQVVNAVLEFLRSLPGRALELLNKLPDLLRALGVAAMGKLLEGLGEAAGDVFGFFLGLPKRILDAVGDLGKVLFNAGVDLIKGLLDGIKSKAGDVSGFLGGLVPDGLPDFIPGASSGRLAVNPGSLLDDFVERLSDMRVAPAMAGSSFLPSDFGSAATPSGPRRVVLSVGGREFDAYVDERADTRVGSAAAMNGQEDRAFG